MPAGSSFKPLARCLGIQSAHVRLNAVYLTEFSRPRALDRIGDVRIIAVHVSDVQYLSAVFDRIDQPLKIRRALAPRLFHVDMLSVIGRHLRVFCQMDLIGFHCHRIYGGIVQYLRKGELGVACKAFQLVRAGLSLVLNERISNDIKKLGHDLHGTKDLGAVAVFVYADLRYTYLFHASASQSNCTMGKERSAARRVYNFGASV